MKIVVPPLRVAMVVIDGDEVEDPVQMETACDGQFFLFVEAGPHQLLYLLTVKTIVSMT